MKKLRNNILFLALIISFSACNNQADNQDALETDEFEEDETLIEDTEADEPGDQVITLTSVELEQFPGASLAMNSPANNASLQSGANRFSFDVQNYELGAQSTMPANYDLANSDNGQHIHFIVDNDPYSAYYEPVFDHEMSEGDHVVLAFLSRSYHASVKNPNSFVVKKFTVGSSDGNGDVDLTAPHMFYSRPKGTYTGTQTEAVLLDFFLVNTDLSPDGNRVRITVNNDREFIVDEWQPYVLENLPMGENTIKLELIDANKNLIASPFNPVTRTITLEEAKAQ